MAKDVLMPLLSPSMTEGTLVKWLKKEGDTIKSGDVLAEVETDKATMDLEAFDAGILRKILVSEGDKVPINSRIGIIGSKDEKLDLSAGAPVSGETAAAASDPARSANEQNAPASIAKEKEVSVPMTTVTESSANISVATPNGANGGRIKASPLAKKIATAQHVDLAQLSGTGPGGRIVKKDVIAAAEAAETASPKPATAKTDSNAKSGAGPATNGQHALAPRTDGGGMIAEEGVQKLSTMRSVIAKRLVESKSQIPHFYLAIEIDAKPMLDLRTQLNESLCKLKPPAKLSLNDFVLKAAAEAIRRVPGVNASFTNEGIRQFGHVQLSFAVAINEGLITPIIPEAQNKSLLQISNEAKALAAKAREGKLKPEEFQGGTFTISNLGMLGIDHFFAIINPPQAGILAVGNIIKKPVVNAHDEIVVGHRQSLTLSCDHRVIDGAVGAAFMKELRELIENPLLLLV